MADDVTRSPYSFGENGQEWELEPVEGYTPPPAPAAPQPFTVREEQTGTEWEIEGYTPPDPADKPWAITRGFISTTAQQNPDLMAEAMEGASYLTGSENLRAGADSVRAFGEWAKTRAPDYQMENEGLGEVRGLDDFMTWLGESAGQGAASMLPSVAASMGGATAGGAAGGAVAGPGGAAVGAVAGGVAGASAVSYGFAYGELYKALKEEGVDPARAAEVAALGAVPIAALDAIPAERVASRALGLNQVRRAVARKLAERVADEIAKTGATEGVTEMAQEFTKQGVLTLETGENKFDLGEGLEAGAAGAAGGALMGAGTGLIPDQVQPQPQPGAQAGAGAPPAAAGPTTTPTTPTAPQPPPTGQGGLMPGQTVVPVTVVPAQDPNATAPITVAPSVPNAPPVVLSPEDQRSLVPSQRIADGKAIMEQALTGTLPAVPAAGAAAATMPTPPVDEEDRDKDPLARLPGAPVLAGAAGAGAGARVNVTMGGKTQGGTIEEEWQNTLPEGMGTEQGVRVRLDDGTVIDEPRSTLDDMGITLSPQAEAITERANEAATSPTNDLPEPTPAQKEAGNYKVGRVRIGGMDISVENPKGSERKGTDKDGNEWSVTMPGHYGYIRRTEGADGDHVDVYVGDSPDSNMAFIVDQVDADSGTFDEHKVVLGARTREEAQALYDAGFSDGRGAQRRGNVTAVSVEGLKTWLRDGNQTEPFRPIRGRDGEETLAAPADPRTPLVDTTPGADPQARAREEWSTATPERRQQILGRTALKGRKDEIAGRRWHELSPDEQRRISNSMEDWREVDSRAAPVDARPDPVSTAADPVDTPAPPVGAPIVQSNGKPWSKIGPAILAAKQRSKAEGVDYEAVKIADGEFGIQRTAGAPQQNEQSDRRIIGRNADGDTITEDRNGVRSRVNSRGIRISEPVQVIPGRGTVVDQSRRSDEFKTTEDQDSAEGGVPNAEAAKGSTARTADGKPVPNDRRDGEPSLAEAGGAKVGDRGTVPNTTLGPAEIEDLWMRPGPIGGDPVPWARVRGIGGGPAIVRPLSQFKRDEPAAEQRAPEPPAKARPEESPEAFARRYIEDKGATSGVGAAMYDAGYTVEDVASLDVEALGRELLTADAVLARNEAAKKADRESRLAAAFDRGQDDADTATTDIPEPAAREDATDPRAVGYEAGRTGKVMFTFGQPEYINGWWQGRSEFDVTSYPADDFDGPFAPYNSRGELPEGFGRNAAIEDFPEASGAAALTLRKAIRDEAERRYPVEGDQPKAGPRTFSIKALAFINGATGRRWDADGITGSQWLDWRGAYMAGREWRRGREGVGDDRTARLAAAFDAGQDDADRAAAPAVDPRTARRAEREQTAADERKATTAARKKAPPREDQAAWAKADSNAARTIVRDFISGLSRAEYAHLLAEREDFPAALLDVVENIEAYELVDSWGDVAQDAPARTAEQTRYLKGLRARVKAFEGDETWGEEARADGATMDELLSFIDGGAVEDLKRAFGGERGPFRLERRMNDGSRAYREIINAIDGFYDVARDDKAPPADTTGDLLSQPAQPRPAPRTKGQAAKSAAANTVKGADAALDALVALFGGPKLGSGFTFDEKTYEQAKPLFIEAASRFRDAAKDISDLMRMMVGELRARGMPREGVERMKPYAIRFIADVDDGIISLAPEPDDGSLDNPLDQTGEPEAGPDMAGGQPDGNGDDRGVAGDAAEDGRRAGGGRGARGGGSRAGGSGAQRQGRRPGRGDAADGRDGAGGEGLAPEGAGGRDQPVPEPVRPSYHITDPESLIGGTPKVRFSKNRAAIEAFRAVSEEHRDPTPAELDAMASYIGWGSFGQELFQGTWERPQPKDGWQKEDEWLRGHLGKEEWESAQNSIINAHYTDPPTVQTMWDMVRAMGFKGGRVLEPSMGIGNFFGLMPRDLMGHSNLTGIELDRLTGGMAKLLYPQANVQLKPYQDSLTADGFYDLVIGNWPFSDVGPADRRYNRLSPTLHDYFFLKAIDQVRPGGLVIGITSAGTLDKAGRATRIALAEKADLVHAFRLPSGAFEKYAGTAVVTDLIVLRKRMPGEEPGPREWTETVEVSVPSEFGGQEKIRLNRYYAEARDHILGELAFGSGSTYGRPSMIVRRPADLMDRLKALPGRVKADAYTPIVRGKEPRFITNNTTDRQQSIVEQKGKLYVVQGDRLTLLADVEKWELKDKKKTERRADQLKRAVAIRRAYGALIDAERDGLPDVEDRRAALRREYEGFTKAHGTLRRSDALRIMDKVRDPAAPMLAALEHNGRPARIIYEAATRMKRRPANPSIRDAFVMMRNETSNVDLEQVAELAGRPLAEVQAELLGAKAVYRTPGGGFEVADVFLSGNVRRKLREAIEAKDAGEDMDASIAALRKAQPADIPYFNIEAKLGASWMPADVYRGFIGHLLGTTETAESSTIETFLGSWKVRFHDGQNSRPEADTWGHSRVAFSRLMQSAMNNQKIIVRVPDEDGKPVVDDALTAEANEKARLVREEFSTWVWQDPVRRVELEKAYNEAMNNIAIPSYDGSFLDFPGMALRRGNDPFALRAHQVDAIWRGVANGRGLYAHEVGTGKTYTMGGIAVESRRYGLARKPLLIAHNANSATVAREINDMYPGARVLYIDNLSPETIKQKLYQIANDDWDAIVVPHSLVDRFGMSEATLMEMAAEEIAALETEALAAAEEDGADLTVEDMADEDAMKKVRSVTAKQLVKQRNRIIETIKKQAQRASQEGAVTFEDLGIDMILVDEVHEFKKPPIATKMQMKGLSTETSNKALQLNFLTRYIKKMNGGRGVHIFTGTPITNTLTEIYHMMRYVMDDEMEQASVGSWDHWFNTFADAASDVELTSTGEYEAVTRLAAFVNVAELRRMAGQYMDIVFADQMPEFTPRATATGKTYADELSPEEQRELDAGRTEQPTGRPYKRIVNDIAPMGEAQKAMLAELRGRAATFKAMSKKDRRQAMLEGDRVIPLIVDREAAEAAMDPRLVDMEAPDEPGNKNNRVVKNVAEIYRSHPLATQVIFVEKGYSSSGTRRTGTDSDGKPVRASVPKFNMVAELVEKLVASGIPREEIGLVTGNVSKEKRKEIADKMNRAEIRVVIGQTQTLGVGVNMQENLRAMHHMDAPWRPGDLEQRNGRGQRQGNRWNTVLEYRYITEGLDGRRWQVLAIKDRFIKAFMRADENQRVIDGEATEEADDDTIDSISETLSLASGDPRILLVNKLKADIQKIENRERMHSQGVADTLWQIKSTERTAEANAGWADELRPAAAHWEAVKETDFEAVIGGVTFSERPKATDALKPIIEQMAKIAADLGDKPNRDSKAFRDAEEWREIGVIRGFTVRGRLEYRPLALGDRWTFRFEMQAPGSAKWIWISAPTPAAVEGKARNIGADIAGYEKNVDEARASVVRMKDRAAQPFQQADQLVAKRAQLDALEKDLQDNPSPPPSWLRTGAPVGSEVFVRTDAGLERRVVEGHRWTAEDYVVVTDQGEIGYREARGPDGAPLYEEMVFQPPVQQGATAGAAAALQKPGEEQREADEDDDGGSLASRQPFGQRMNARTAPLVAAVEKLVEEIAGARPQVEPRLLARDLNVPGAAPDEDVAGAYTPATDALRLALYFDNQWVDADDLMETGAHEAFHRLQLRFFTERELKILRDAVPAMRRFMEQEAGTALPGQPYHEVQAYAFQVWYGIKAGLRDAQGPITTMPPLVRALWDRITKFLRRVGNLARGRGFKTWEDLFEDARTGRIAARGDRGRNPDEWGRITAANAAADGALPQGQRIGGQPGSASTQIATTTGSYRKAADMLKALGVSGRVLDYGAGLGLGTDAMREAGLDVRSYEPFPGRWQGARPVDYTSSAAVPETFDALVNLNVLNVLEPGLRETVVRDMLSKLAPGGRALIGTRGWSGDVAGARNIEPAAEDKAVWVLKGDQRVYQKGFDGAELVDYVSAIAGPGFTVRRAFGIGKNGVLVTRDAASLPQLFRLPRRPGPTQPVIFRDPATEARFKEAQKGIGGSETFRQQVIDKLALMKAGFSRRYLSLPNDPRFANLKEQLRKLEAAPVAAREQVIRYLRELTHGMEQADLDLFTRKVILDDLVWEDAQQHELPFGFTSASLKQAVADVDAALAGRPDLIAKVRMRKSYNKRIARMMVDAGIFTEEQIKNPSYYRHQVLEYAIARRRQVSTSSRLRSPKWAKREGSHLDINANLLEAEFEWITRALTNLEEARVIDWIDGSVHNVRGVAVATAKAKNRDLVRDALDADMQANGFVQNGKPTSPMNEEWKGFRRNIAIGFKFVEEAINNANLIVPARFKDAADALAAGVDDPMVFPFLSWLLDGNKPGAQGAAIIMKAISQRRAWMEKTLGDAYTDPQDIELVARRFAPEGHVTWQPDEGRMMFMVKTIAEHGYDRLLDGLQQAVAGSKVISPEMVAAALKTVKPMLATGGQKYQMILPQEVADTLNEMNADHRVTWGSELFEAPMRLWKRWILLNPRSVLKYNLNNLSGDMDAVIAGNPRALRKMPQAIAELYRVMIRKQAPSDRYKEAVERGVMDSGMSINEIPDIGLLTEFEALINPPTVREPVRFAASGLRKVWNVVSGYTQFRENWLRYAAYLDYIERIEAGETIEQIGYGASHPKMVEQITDPKDRAALLARQLVGDYGDISHYGQDIRRKVIPFYSWMEVNMRRYWRLTANAFGQGVGKGLATGTGLGVAMGARTTVWLLFRMALVYALVQAWNNLMFPDEEDELDELERLRLHITLGRDAEGRVVTLKFQGAFSDFLSWFGMPDVAVAIGAMEEGKADLGDVLATMAKAPINKTLTSITPLVSQPIQFFSGQKYWPDVFNPRQIRDSWREVFSTFRLEHEYDLVMGKPSRGYGESWVGAAVNRYDTGEVAYNTARSWGYDWLEEKKGGSGGGGGTTDRSRALYEWRQAQRFGDVSAEQRAWDRMMELGIDRRSLTRSIASAHPLGMIAKKDRAEYLDSLSEQDRETLQMAIEWYLDTYRPAAPDSPQGEGEE